MKIQTLVLIAATATSLTLIPAAHADPAGSTKQRAEVQRMLKDKEARRMALHEMMKDTETKRMMAKELAKDKEFRDFYSDAVGNNAPHEERNPSQHPELFRAKSQ